MGEKEDAVKKWQNLPNSKKKKSSKRSSHLGSLSGGLSQELTITEKEIKGLLIDEHLTTKQISIRRGTSVRSVQKTINKLKKKGAISKANQKVRFFGITCEPNVKIPSNYIRLHREEWRVIILYKDNFYKDLMERSNFFEFDGNTIRLSRDSIEVYVSKSFIAESVNKATKDSVEYFDNFLTKLEHQLKVILKKPRVQNIKRVNAHYSETDNEVAKDYEEKGERIKIYGRDDGKLWFLIDNSFNLHEAEAVHPTESQDDMGLVKGAFDDIRTGEWERLKYGIKESKENTAQLMMMIKGLIEATVNLTQSQLNSTEKIGFLKEDMGTILEVQKEYAEQIKKHLVVQDKTLESLQGIDKGIQRFSKVTQKLNANLKAKTPRDQEARLLRIKAVKEEYGW